MTTFGFQVPNFTFGEGDDQIFANVVDLVEVAQDVGFESVWVMDHFYQLPALGGGTQPMLEGYTLLGALAAVTSTVRLGTLVTGVTYRNPAMLAKQVTTLDVISQGRAILGIGAAWHDTEHEAMGFDFPPVKERMDRLEEAVQICRAMFREETPTFDGRYYRVHEVHNMPRPIQPGGPKIMIGGGGEKRTLKLVAKYADMCNISGDAATVKHKLGVLREHCATVGRDPSEITATRLATLMITNSAQETAQTREFLVQAAGEEAAAGFNVGEEQEIVEQVGELVEAGLDTLIFNLPLGGPEAVDRAGTLLVNTFS
jgi:F420-dependent oxidoreductase-like protein